MDYRRVNSRTPRAVYHVRRSEDVKAEVAGSVYMTFLDADTGFNQLVNTMRARQMLAIIARSGQFLPILNFSCRTEPYSPIFGHIIGSP